MVLMNRLNARAVAKYWRLANIERLANIMMVLEIASS
ncbi:hypothetical protein ABID39_001204 [Bartonella japonica]|uniref:Uncharacterized protein n=1 Tax=Bartonella japonica TaxID=357761 RepID=A0ABV2FPP3_9HYPH